MDALNPRYRCKLSAGDRVAVLSPSSAGPALFPAPYELGLRRLRERFELEPVEYPTTRMLGASPQDRAADIHAAFNDPSIKAVLTSIGGDDQLKVLRHLDPDVLTRNPKPFVGYSDNTNLLHYLWRLGIVGYHGPTVMVELGRPGRMHPLTEESLRRALFTSGPFDLPQVTEGTDEPQTDWNDSATLRDEPALAQVTTWQWHGPRRRVEGRSWGGCLEIIDYHLRANRYLGPPEDFAGGVLFFETSEQIAHGDLRLRGADGHGRARHARAVPGHPGGAAQGLVPSAAEHGEGQAPLPRGAARGGPEGGDRVRRRGCHRVRRRLRAHRPPGGAPVWRQHHRRRGRAATDGRVLTGRTPNAERRPQPANGGASTLSPPPTQRFSIGARRARRCCPEPTRQSAATTWRASINASFRYSVKAVATPGAHPIMPPLGAAEGMTGSPPGLSPGRNPALTSATPQPLTARRRPPHRPSTPPLAVTDHGAGLTAFRPTRPGSARALTPRLPRHECGGFTNHPSDPGRGRGDAHSAGVHAPPVDTGRSQRPLHGG